MNALDTIKALDKLTGGDKEADHADADSLLFDFLLGNGHENVALAYHNAQKRAGGWWYA